MAKPKVRFGKMLDTEALGAAMRERMGKARESLAGQIMCRVSPVASDPAHGPPGVRMPSPFTGAAL